MKCFTALPAKERADESACAVRDVEGAVVGTPRDEDMRGEDVVGRGRAVVGEPERDR